MLNKDIVFKDVCAKDSSEFLGYISDILFEKGYVKETFKQAILKREMEYPTGVSTQKFNLAIPHTDAEFVNKNGIAFIRFKDRCHFRELCTNNDVDVDMAFLLLVANKDEQVVVLSKLMEIFSNDELLESIYNEDDEVKIVELVNNQLV